MFTERDLLKTDGKNLVNQDGQVVHLRGTSLGGWLHREGWMDGGGACLQPLPVVKTDVTDDGVSFELQNVHRCNRIAFEGSPVGEFVVETSLDGENWTETGRSDFSNQKTAQLDKLRPAPYAPGVIVYDEGCFVEGHVIHTNEFFTKYLKVTAKGITAAKPMEYGDIDEFGGRAIVESRFGKEKAEEMLKAYQDCYIRESDLKYIKEIGFNFVRVPIYWQEIMDTDGNIKDNAFENIDWVLDVCKELELYVMLDYHAAPGGNTMGSITAGQLDANELWDNETYQEMSFQILETMAERYAEGHPEISSYDLLNEPCILPPSYIVPDMTGIELPTTPTLYYKLPLRMSEPVRSFYKTAYTRVRAVDQHHILCMQQFADFNLIGQPEVYGWDNVMYQIHCYPVGNWRNHDEVKASMEAYAQTIRENLAAWHVPCFAGEFCCWEFMDVWEDWMKALNEMGVNWAHWSYKITDPTKKDNWSLFYDYDGIYADYYQESAEEITAKWSTYNTEHYKNNVELAQLLTKYAVED